VYAKSVDHPAFHMYLNNAKNWCGRIIM